MEFFPTKKQTEEYLKSVFIEKGLAEVVKLHKAQASYEAKRELTQVNIVFLFWIKLSCTQGKNFTWRNCHENSLDILIDIPGAR